MIAPANPLVLTGFNWDRVPGPVGECGRCGNALLSRERGFCTRCLELARQVLNGQARRADLLRV